MRKGVVIPAAGSGRRMGGRKKQFLSLGGKTVLEHTLTVFLNHPEIAELVVVLPAEDLSGAYELLAPFLKQWGCVVATPASFVTTDGKRQLQLVPGGRERQDSVFHGLEALKDRVELVVVHDAARPFVTRELLDRVVRTAVEKGAATAAVPVADTVVTVADNDRAGEFLPRSSLRAVQTPQAFRFSLLWEAHLKARREGYYGTDDAGLVVRAGHPVYLVEGDPGNFKITTPADLKKGEALLEGKKKVLVGMGYDVHRLVEGRKLVLGGVEIPYSHGLLGHSDADVLLHALCDALLGAVGAGDIGRHFPDTDPSLAGISSLVLLERTVALVREKGFRVQNADVTVVAQAPRLGPYVEEMRANIARVLGVETNRVNVKATTTEKLGFTGRGEGIAAYAVVTVTEV